MGALIALMSRLAAKSTPATTSQPFRRAAWSSRSSAGAATPNEMAGMPIKMVRARLWK
jgi:hypothetical protein